MAQRPTRIPGDEDQTSKPAKDGITALNNTSDDPNEIARKRERQAAVMAMAATGGEGELAPPPALDAAPAVREKMIGGERVRVHMPTVRRNDVVQKYGPESRLPKGTLVRKDGTPTEGDEQAYGVIGDIEVPTLGRLVSRVIPFDDDEPAEVDKPRESSVDA